MVSGLPETAVGTHDSRGRCQVRRERPGRCPCQALQALAWRDWRLLLTVRHRSTHSGGGIKRHCGRSWRLGSRVLRSRSFVRLHPAHIRENRVPRAESAAG